MSRRQKLLNLSLPLGALLLAFSANAESLPPLTLVAEPYQPHDIVPTKMAVLESKKNSAKKHARKSSANPVKQASLTLLTAEGARNVWSVNLPAPKPRLAAAACVSHVINWQRSCSDFGYPQNYTGIVQGKTQVDCSAQEQRDSWLRNSCAAPVAVAAAAPKLTPPIVASAVPAAPAAAAPVAASAVAPVLTFTPIASAAPAAPEISAAVSQPVAVPEPPSVQLAAIQNDPPVIAGICGQAAHLKLTAPPKSSLCAAGQPGSVMGQGPWQWSCNGMNGGVEATCIALVDVAALAVEQFDEPAVPPPAETVEAKAKPAPTPAPVVTLAEKVEPALAASQVAVPVLDAAPSLAVVPPTVAAVPPAPQPILAAAAPAASLTTPQLVSPSLVTSTLTTQTQALGTAALATPRLTLPQPSPLVQAGATDYAPAEPIRASAALRPATSGNAGMVSPELATMSFTAGKDAPDDDVLGQLELLGQKLMTNRLAKVTVTAYAAMGDGTDARAARRLSLARAMVVRDALLLGGASSDQIRIRAMGANAPAGVTDRVDLTDN